MHMGETDGYGGEARPWGLATGKEYLSPVEYYAPLKKRRVPMALVHLQPHMLLLHE